MSIHRILLAAAGLSRISDQWITVLGSSTDNEISNFITNDSSGTCYGVGTSGTKNFVYSLNNSDPRYNTQYTFDDGASCITLGTTYFNSKQFFTGRNSSGYIFLSNSNLISNTKILGYGSSVVEINSPSNPLIDSAIVGKKSGGGFVVCYFNSSLTNSGTSSEINSTKGNENSFEIVSEGDYVYFVGFAQDVSASSDYQIVVGKLIISSITPIVWKKRLGASGKNYSGYGISLGGNSSTGNVYICGATSDSPTKGIISKYNKTTSNNSQIIFASNTSNVVLRDICTDSSENVYITGDRGNDLFIAKLNTTLSVSWQQNFSKTGYTIIPSGISTDDSYLYVSATETYISDSSSNTATLKISIDGVTPGTYENYKIQNSSITFTSETTDNTNSTLASSLLSFIPSVTSLSTTTTSFPSTTTNF